VILDRLASVVGAHHVLTDPDLTAPFETDWTRRWTGRSLAVVRPADTMQVAHVVAACAEHGVAVVPQGGNTGLVGGAAPRGGEVVLSLIRLSELGPVDVAASQITAGAGVTLARLQENVTAAGLRFGVDLAARDSATMGGLIATNAGGVHVLRYGSMRSQVVGIEAVLANGRVVSHLSGLVKDNTGYDLAGLLCGSEGTLGVVTAARLRLVPEPRHRVTALVGLGDVEAAVEMLTALRQLATLEAVEVTFSKGIELVCAYAQLPPPFPVSYPCVLVVECAGGYDPTAELGDALAGALDTAVAADGAGRARLWSWRERHTDAVSALGVPHKLDVTVPVAAVPAFVVAITALERTGVEIVIWGHLGDGNLHVNVVGPGADDLRVDDAVLRMVADFHGSISAEHGIGVAKRRWLHLSRSEAELAAMVAIKRGLDPLGILNPGVLLPGD